MYHGIWGQSLLIDKDSRVDIRMTDYDKISKLVPKERVKDTQTSFWLKDEFSYFKLSLNVSSKKNLDFSLQILTFCLILLTGSLMAQ